MKKLLGLIVCMLLTVSAMCARDRVSRDVNLLPTEARELIKNHFAEASISYLKVDKNLFRVEGYDVRLTDGTELDFCRYIGEVEIVNLPAVPVHDTLDYCENMGGFGYKYYNIDIPYDEIFNFKFNADGDFNIVLCDSDFNETDLLDISMYSTNGCDVDLQQGRYYLCVKNTVNTNNEFNMTVTPPCLSHSFTEWTQHTPARHIECCEYCGEKGTITSPHAIRKEDISKLFANCMVCGQLVNLKNTIVNVPEMNKITQVTLNGSYILPNGIIVLVDEDIEAYENGTLVWYDKDDLPQTQ